jgi:glycosyltransferase involved in cell wall biosynthesis
MSAKIHGQQIIEQPYYHYEHLNHEVFPLKAKKNLSISLSVLMPVYNEAYTVQECIKRILRVSSPYISELELIIVDDGSTDGTRDILREMTSRFPQITYVEHEKNLGKGAAVRTAIKKATMEVCIVQDADLEYNPADYSKLVMPFIFERADAVFGSRFLSGEYRRVLYFRHSVINRIITFLVSLVTDINYSDIETCYKAIRTHLLKSIPIRSQRFNIEPEICIKLAKRGASIFEVPISYAGRTKEEGKKIGLRDGLSALWTILKYWLIDDIYEKDSYGSSILYALSYAKRFTHWMADAIRPYLGDDILEIGAGLGNLTVCFIPRKKYMVSDISWLYLDYLENYSLHKPYMRVKRIDLTKKEDFSALEDSFDTCLCVNVLEHVEDDYTALRNLYAILEPGGKVIILVPQGKWLYSKLDEVLGHYRRYTAKGIESLMEQVGFQVEELMASFNKIGVLSWIFNGKILRRKHFSRVQLKILNMFTWFFRLINPVLPWPGLSIIAIGRKPYSG